MRFVAVLISVLGLACGQVAKPDVSADGGVDDTDANIGPDVTAPVVQSSIPRGDAVRVSILTGTVDIVLDEALDPASVDSETVSVVDRHGRSVAGESSYRVDDHTLVFTFSDHLGHNQEYTVQVGAVQDEAGNLSAPTSFGFRTFVNPEVRATTRVAGAITAYWGRLIDDDGHHMVNNAVVEAGSDGTWYSHDDPIARRETYVREGWKLLSSTHFAGPGTDGVWDTADDVADYARTHDYDAHDLEVRRVLSYDAGPDGTFLTADDVPDNVLIYNRGAVNGEILERLYYVGPGADGAWFTSDDELQDRHTYSYGSSGELTRRVHYRGGVVVAYLHYEYAPNGELLRLDDFRDPGDDGNWYTADDVPTTRTYYKYSGYLLRSAQASTGRGPDGNWGTADDDGRLTTYVYDDDGIRQRSVLYRDPGADGIWRTSDDTVQNYVDQPSDSKGNRLRLTVFTAPGADGTWFTADDDISTERLYEVDR